MEIIIPVVDNVPTDVVLWFETVRQILTGRVSADFDDGDAMVAAFILHN